MPPYERGDLALSVMPPLANDDYTVELFALRLVDRHDLDPRWIVDTTQDLVLGKCKIEYITRVRVLAILSPKRSKCATYSSATIECHEVVKILCSCQELLLA